MISGQDFQRKVGAVVPRKEREEKNRMGILARVPQSAHVGKEAVPQRGPLDAELLFQLAPENGKPGDQGVFICNQAGHGEARQGPFH